jgi:hypothetical protein
MEATGHRIMTYELVRALLGAGQFDEAAMIVDREYRSEPGRLAALIRIAAAQGDTAATQELWGQYEPVSDRPSEQMITHAVLGKRERANEIAAEIDATPFGYLVLIRAIHTCACGAPFDLEATPNFAERFAEAGFAWPPLAPVDWPLKNW